MEGARARARSLVEEPDLRLARRRPRRGLRRLHTRRALVDARDGRGRERSGRRERRPPTGPRAAAAPGRGHRRRPERRRHPVRRRDAVRPPPRPRSSPRFSPSATGRSRRGARTPTSGSTTRARSPRRHEHALLSSARRPPGARHRVLPQPRGGDRAVAGLPRGDGRGDLPPLAGARPRPSSTISGARPTSRTGPSRPTCRIPTRRARWSRPLRTRWAARSRSS